VYSDSSAVNQQPPAFRMLEPSDGDGRGERDISDLIEASETQSGSKQEAVDSKGKESSGKAVKKNAGGNSEKKEDARVKEVAESRGTEVGSKRASATGQEKQGRDSAVQNIDEDSKKKESPKAKKVVDKRETELDSTGSSKSGQKNEGSNSDRWGWEQSWKNVKDYSWAVIEQHKETWGAAVSANTASCAPGWVPVLVGADAAGGKDVVAWQVGTETWHARCVQPVLLPVNQPIQV
jgi:hypothetical protein